MQKNYLASELAARAHTVRPYYSLLSYIAQKEKLMYPYISFSHHKNYIRNNVYPNLQLSPQRLAAFFMYVKLSVFPELLSLSW
jgi:hypothetical protein